MRISSFRTLLFLLMVYFLVGCANKGLEKIRAGALELVGVSAKDSAAGDVPSNRLRLDLYAGRNLNADERGHGMSVVVNFYRLRDPAVFLQTPYDVLADVERARKVLAADLIEVKELVLKPRQEVSRDEELGASASYLGVVALFRKPFPDRWRLVFAAAEKANARGLVLGAHECALTVSRGRALNAQLVNPESLGGVHCR